MRRHHYILTPLVVLAVVLMTACRPSTPSNILSQRVMEDVLYDYHLALAMADNSSQHNQAGSDAEALRYRYTQKVFAKHHITEAEFDSSMVWYSSHYTYFKEVCDKVSARMDADAKTLGIGLSETELYANYRADGDTANVWSGRKIVFLPNVQPDNIAIINFPADSTYLPGDSYKLSFNANFLPSFRGTAVYVLFSVYYKDSTQVSATQYVSGDYKVELNLRPRGEQLNAIPDHLTIQLYAPPSAQGHTLFFMTYPSVLRMHAEKKSESPVTDAAITGSAVDSLQVDSMVVTDTLPDQKRLSPLEERNQREERHDIHIVKERVMRPAPSSPARVRRAAPTR